ncbi:MAG TPA: AEC family transporter [Luteolibacter sp.]|nr:AEC family transporter [Luteolibacter sp.]
MISPWVVLQSVAWVYLLILAGVIARRSGLMPRASIEPIMQVVYMLMLPCFIVDKILGADILRSGGVVVSALLCGFCLILGGVAVGGLVGKLIGLSRGNGIRTFALASGAQNYGFTAMPVIDVLWCTAAMTGPLAVLFVHNIGVELALWSVGVMIVSGEQGIRWKRLCNGLVIGVVLGLLMVVCRIDHILDGPVRQSMHMLGAGAFPLGIFIIGATIMDQLGDEKPSVKIISASLVTRLLLVPALFLVAAKYLPIADELRKVIVVQAAMPSAVTPIILARLYGGRTPIAVHIVIATTIASLFSLPWIISVGCWWIGLKPVLP